MSTASLDSPRLNAALEKATAALLAARSPEGHWQGELSSSALSTATAVTALAVVGRNSQLSTLNSQLSAGLDWLAQNQNADGGWGDTVLSLSNLSTTTLCWAAFGVVRGAKEKFRAVLDRAEDWLRKQAGGLAPDQLAPAIIARYGKDRTFSVPILTMCALAGRLGSGREAWRHVIPLPFELAAFPHQFFAALRLPVVSYALPALIAIGQARHHHCPPRNPFARFTRNVTRERTLKILETIQPGNGGFLEATPLTSFVVMSLAGSGQVHHLVTRRGVEFLKQSQRADGSWPIDTNLATWVTTLAVNALGISTLNSQLSTSSPARGPGVKDEDSALREWLLRQQYRREHPYTHAAPGGWAWTDLPGGVPDADDTAGALLALRQLEPIDAQTREAASAGISWLLGLQNNDGGIPTFCRGWGALPFDRSSADITAHVIRAWLAWRGELPVELRARVNSAIRRAVDFLATVQRADGAWVPLWFGNEFAPLEENPTYGTSRVLHALVELPPEEFPKNATMVERGVRCLLASQSVAGAWGGAARTPPSVEETALALEALAAVLRSPLYVGKNLQPTLVAAVDAGTDWLLTRVESGQWKHPTAIGFYFAKLWYYERLYPMIFTVGALRSVAECRGIFDGAVAPVSGTKV